MHPRFACVMLVLVTAEAARLLAVLPTNTRSHYAMYGKLIDALARKQHYITVISHFPMKYTSNVHHINLAGTIPEIINNLTVQDHSLKPYMVRNLEQIIKECVDACNIVSQNPLIKSIINSNVTYDLVIVEVFGSDCFLPLGMRFKAPVVGLLSSVPLPWVNEQLGNPDSTAYIPSYMVGYGQHMNVWERFFNTIAVVFAKYLYRYKSQKPSQIIADRLFGPGPKLEHLARNYSLVLSNSHFSINEVRPLVPNLIEVGGLHLDTTLILPLDMQKHLDSSMEGVIYWSFGSMSRIETIASDKLSQILDIMSHLPHSVFVKLNSQMLSRNLTQPDNVHAMDWIPQYATLCHPNVKLFISHGGLLGIQEAVACAVPMLIVPLYADQALNARAMVDRGVARVVNLRNFDKCEWIEALHDLLTNPVYKQNTLKLRDIFLDRPMHPLDLGVYWIEYVLRHKGAIHMRSPALNLSLTQYLLLDVIAIGIAAVVTTIFILHILFRYLCTRCIKWWPREKVIFEKRLFKKNVSFILCLVCRRKMKIN